MNSSSDHFLKIDQDVAFERRTWYVERVAWIIFALLLFAGLLGLLGEGPLSQAQTQSPDQSLILDYERFLRRHAPTELEFTITPASPDPTHLWINADYFELVQLEEVVPIPLEIQAYNEWMIFVFHIPSGPARVLFRLEAEKPATVTARAVLNDPSSTSAAVSFRQLIYP